MSNKKVFTNSQVEDIINLYTNEKISMSKIGEKYDCTKNVIRRVLTENNIEIKKTIINTTQIIANLKLLILQKKHTGLDSSLLMAVIIKEKEMQQ